MLVSGFGLSLLILSRNAQLGYINQSGANSKDQSQAQKYVSFSHELHELTRIIKALKVSRENEKKER
jgi:hypothetical protein